MCRKSYVERGRQGWSAGWCVGVGCGVHWACFANAALLVATDLSLAGEEVPQAYICHCGDSAIKGIPHCPAVRFIPVLPSLQLTHCFKHLLDN